MVICPRSCIFSSTKSFAVMGSKHLLLFNSSSLFIHTQAPPVRTNFPSQTHLLGTHNILFPFVSPKPIFPIRIRTTPYCNISRAAAIPRPGTLLAKAFFILFYCLY